MSGNAPWVHSQRRENLSRVHPVHHEFAKQLDDEAGQRVAVFRLMGFEGQAENEKAIVAAIDGDKAPALKVGDVIVKIDQRYYRPTEVETLLGDATKAKEKLGWVPEITLDQMIVEMVANDLDQAKQRSLLKKYGYSVAVGQEN